MMSKSKLRKRFTIRKIKSTSIRRHLNIIMIIKTPYENIRDYIVIGLRIDLVLINVQQIKEDMILIYPTNNLKRYLIMIVTIVESNTQKV